MSEVSRSFKGTQQAFGDVDLSLILLEKRHCRNEVRVLSTTGYIAKLTSGEKMEEIRRVAFHHLLWPDLQLSLPEAKHRGTITSREMKDLLVCMWIFCLITEGIGESLLSEIKRPSSTSAYLLENSAATEMSMRSKSRETRMKSRREGRDGIRAPFAAI
jgi:hypothetical protein